MKKINLVILALFIVSCSSSTPMENSENLQESYIAYITKCTAKNHTLINKEKTVDFLSGGGDADVQVMKFIKNSRIKKLGLTATVNGITVGADFELEGEKVNTVNLRRKKHGEIYSYKAGEGRWYVAGTKCEKFRKNWALVNKRLEFQFVE